jgi:hypothetical protein
MLKIGSLPMMLQNSTFVVINFSGSMQGCLDCVRLDHEQIVSLTCETFDVATRAKTVNLRWMDVNARSLISQCPQDGGVYTSDTDRTISTFNIGRCERKVVLISHVERSFALHITRRMSLLRSALDWVTLKAVRVNMSFRM